MEERKQSDGETRRTERKQSGVAVAVIGFVHVVLIMDDGETGGRDERETNEEEEREQSEINDEN